MVGSWQTANLCDIQNFTGRKPQDSFTYKNGVYVFQYWCYLQTGIPICAPVKKVFNPCFELDNISLDAYL